jgi:hypothetical protein
METSAMRYVVLIKPPDDHPGMVKIMGTFRDRARALELQNKVRAVIEDDIEDESPGYAYVIAIEPPRLGVAKRWALRGE